MNFNAFIYLLLTVIQLCYSKLSDQCTKSNTFWYSLKYSYNDILKLQTTQSSTFSCPTVSSQNCCSSEMSKDMTGVSELRLKEFSEERISKILMMLTNDSYDLMNIYLQDLENTKIDLNKLFSTTYGYNYKVHRDFFYQFFDKLKLYMQGRLNNIDKIIDTFFLDMAQRIIRILIAPSSTPEMISCHLNRLIEAKPYQDTDVNLKSKINRSYPPARLFVNGIAIGRDVFNELFKNLSPSSKCVQQFNTAFHCMLCQGLTLKPCSQSCNAIIDNCFGSFKSSDTKRLDKALTKYIKSLLQLAGKLDNPFNFPEVNNKMNVQISTAIMGVQSMYPNKKEEIQRKCQGAAGGISISRRKRQASPEFYNWQNAKIDNQKQWVDQTQTKNINEDNKEKRDSTSDQTKPVESLSSFARKIKQKYKSFENYFKTQKAEFCSSMQMTDVSLDCWNGTNVTKNSASIQTKEPKKKGDKVDDPVIKSAIGQLNEITKRINSYMTGSNPDPATVTVQEYKLYVSRKVKKPIEDNQENMFNPKPEGSGELEDSKFPQPNLKPEKRKKDPPNPPPAPQQPDKNNWELPTFPEGSGDSDNKLPIETMKKTPKLPSNPKPAPSSSTASSTRSSTSSHSVGSTKPSTVAPNSLPDDEDLNPPPPPPPPEILPEKKPKMNVPVTQAPIIQPEGSGSQPAIPESGENKPLVPPAPVTTPPPEPIIDGSGEEPKPKQPIDKPVPFLPMLPESPKAAVTNAPTKPEPKPDPNPDEEVQPVEGSGRPPESPNTGSGPSMMPTDPEGKSRRPSVQEPPRPEPTPPPPPPPVAPPTAPPPAPEPRTPYPGVLPPDVWIPKVKEAQHQGKFNQWSTPSGAAPRLFDRIMAIGHTMLILASTLAVL